MERYRMPDPRGSDRRDRYLPLTTCCKRGSIRWSTTPRPCRTIAERLRWGFAELAACFTEYAAVVDMNVIISLAGSFQ